MSNLCNYQFLLKQLIMSFSERTRDLNGGIKAFVLKYN